MRQLDAASGLGLIVRVAAGRPGCWLLRVLFPMLAQFPVGLRKTALSLVLSHSYLMFEWLLISPSCHSTSLQTV